MSQVWHLFRNDLRASKYILMVWFGALAAYVMAAWRDPLAMEVDTHVSDIGIITVVVAVIVAAILIQQDSLVGVRSFWMTRPVRPWALLAAKALFIVVVLMGTQLVACSALLLRFGMPPQELPSTLIRISGEWAWLLATAVVLATVTASAAQAITAGVIAYGATVLGVMDVSALWNGVHYNFDFFSGAALAACCALIVLRYSGLARWQTTGAFVACWAGLILLPLTGWAPAIDGWQPEAPPLTGLTLRAVPVHSGDEAFKAWGDKFIVRWEADGLEPTQLLRFDHLQGEISWQDGGVTRVAERDGQSLGTARGEGLVSRMGFGRPGNSPTGWLRLNQLADPEMVYGKRGVLRARLTGRLQRMYEYGSAPVAAGSTLKDNGYGVRLDSVRVDSDTIAIHLRERRIVRPNEDADWPRLIIFRRDTQGQLHETNSDRSGSRTQGWFNGWPVIGVRGRELFYDRRTQPPEVIDRGPDWIDKAEMTFVSYSPGRRVTLELEASDLCVATRPPGQHYGPGLPCEAPEKVRPGRGRP